MPMSAILELRRHEPRIRKEVEPDNETGSQKSNLAVALRAMPWVWGKWRAHSVIRGAVELLHESAAWALNDFPENCCETLFVLCGVAGSPRTQSGFVGLGDACDSIHKVEVGANAHADRV